MSGPKPYQSALKLCSVLSVLELCDSLHDGSSCTLSPRGTNRRPDSLQSLSLSHTYSLAQTHAHNEKITDERIDQDTSVFI